MPMPKKPKIEKDTAERWLLTYADLMNLLLIFFIVLYAMSQIDVAKFNQLAQSLNVSLGNSSAAPLIDNSAPGGKSLIALPADASSVISAKMEDQQIDELKKQVDKVVDQKGLKGDINVAVQERGVVISINAQLLFKSGSAEIEANSKPTIGEIGDILLQVPGKQIKIEGHTDNDAMNSAIFPSNWELSSARATNVLRLLVDKAHIDPKSISSVGYGEFRPVVPNTTPENKAKNRRVDIVILRDAFDKAEAGISNPTAAPTAGKGTSAPANPPADQNANKSTAASPADSPKATTTPANGSTDAAPADTKPVDQPTDQPSDTTAQ